MTDEKDKPLSPAMVSALQAVARMRGDSSSSALLWISLLEAIKHYAQQNKA